MDTDFPFKVVGLSGSETDLVIDGAKTVLQGKPEIWNVRNLYLRAGGSLTLESDLHITARLVQVEAGGDGGRPHILIVNSSAGAPTSLVLDSDQISGTLLIGQEGPGRSRCSVTYGSLDANSQVQTMMQLTATPRTPS